MDYPRWVACDKRSRRDISGYNATCGDDGAGADCHARQNSSASADPHAILDEDWLRVRSGLTVHEKFMRIRVKDIRIPCNRAASADSYVFEAGHG